MLLEQGSDIIRRLYVLPPERLFECYKLVDETKVLDAFLIYDHFYHEFPPEMLDEKNPQLRKFVAALALQRLQAREEAITAHEVEALRRFLDAA